MTPPLAVAVAGVSGRMGRALLEALAETPEMRLAAALDRAGGELVGRDAGALIGRRLGVTVADDPCAALTGARVLIDFTRPEATLAHAAVCRELGVNLVIGTTGLSPDGKARIQEAARDVAVVFAPNMSVGVTLTLQILRTAARVLGGDFDVEVVEAHHRHKVDAPSGTALRMGEVIAEAQGRRLEDCAVYAREGVTGERPPGAIGFATVRGGDIVGDHTVLFAGAGERVEITHRATSRATFAMGALRAARFLADRPAGLYDMQDVLGLR